MGLGRLFFSTFFKKNIIIQIVAYVKYHVLPIEIKIFV